jgi:hypothetical protein
VANDDYAQDLQRIQRKTYMLDKFSYSCISKSDAEKRKAMWKKSGLGVRCIKKADGKISIFPKYLTLS